MMREIIEKKYSVVEIKGVNEMSVANPKGFVERSEEFYNDQVRRAAQLINQSRKDYKFVLLCGPSASGKTTTAHKLKHRLVDLGMGAQVMSMDNFFRGMVHYPKLKDGSPDMESVEALDMDLLNDCFDELMETGGSVFPVFDFGKQKQLLRQQDIRLGEGDILIMEGIHALNPDVLKRVPREKVFRIYVSVRTKFVNGEDTILVPKDIRLIRRMVRDYNFRNYPPVHTLKYWQHVVESEKINIDLYRDDVELKMDNTIDYEVCVWHGMLHSLMETIDLRDFEEFPQLEKVFHGLAHFAELSPGLIPKNSLLREFLGDDV